MRFRHWLWLLFGAMGFAFLLLQSRTIWLPWIAHYLTTEDRLHSADVIAVFAAKEERAMHAAQLYQKGLAPRILVTGGLTSELVEQFCHKRVTGAQRSARLLIAAGVPESVVTLLPQGTSTYEEAEAIYAFMKTHSYRSVIIVSSPYHMRRVRVTLEHLLQGTDIEALYSAAQDSDFNARAWWRRERDFLFVTTEYLKLVYYHLVLLSGAWA